LRRGNQAEYAVRLVLKEFKKEKLIVKWRQSPRYGQEDQSGIDFTIFIKNGEVIYLQVKFRRKGSDQKLIKSYLEKHRHAIYRGGSYENLVINDHLRKHPDVKNIIMVSHWQIPQSERDYRRINILYDKLFKIIFPKKDS